MAKTLTLQCTSAFMASGKMVLPKQVVDGVPRAEALSLVRRGKAKVIDSVFDSDDSEIEDPALKELTVAELKVVAGEYEIEGFNNMKKADLIAAIEAIEVEDEPAEGNEGEGGDVKDELNENEVDGDK